MRGKWGSDQKVPCKSDEPGGVGEMWIVQLVLRKL